jgi:hypothetical protein
MVGIPGRAGLATGRGALSRTRKSACAFLVSHTRHSVVVARARGAIGAPQAPQARTGCAAGVVVRTAARQQKAYHAGAQEN